MTGAGILSCILMSRNILLAAHFTSGPSCTQRTPLSRPPDQNLAWTSRDHRKHRHLAANPKTGRPRQRANTFHKLGNMTRIEYWNISWWVAVAFTLGSIIWVVNGFIVFLPLINTHVPYSADGAGWSAWVGATVFEFGAVFGLWEAWNRGDVAQFGWNVEMLLHHEKGKTPSSTPGSEQPPVVLTKKWIWFSADGKYFHELGFVAAFVQFWAATIFWISGFTALPTIMTAIETKPRLFNGVFWTPQVIGGTGFIIASTIIMIETQKKWYIPSSTSLGWHIGFWNLVGGIGFTLCGALGYAINDSSKVAYQSSCSTFWGGWAFLIGSVIQWYEAVNPVL
ncbi:hypothetical protein MSAN_02195100 [Mycena sanguinolenta]|uniref:Integral membrane protein n=1 Tax=Mycena sanguinolenta TaxID=230812 RepID=A0A8H6XDH8_9AGAR|nr:hypothetical protein MSAN_02195100 [Mycena sanguinolenta]